VDHWVIQVSWYTKDNKMAPPYFISNVMNSSVLEFSISVQKYDPHNRSPQIACVS